MHPAYSIIFFTSFSGAGYGLLACLGIVTFFASGPGNWLTGVLAVILGLILITAGLLSSTLHLGHPERAWRALSQWRSSWLSREGVMAILTYIPALLLGVALFFEMEVSGVWRLVALLTVLGAIATVACTAMIYASLKPIRHWNNPYVLPLYVAFAAATGLLWYQMLSVFAGETPSATRSIVAVLLITWGGKLLYWRFVANQQPLATLESATGLGAWGKVDPLDPPHTEENYLQKEMGHRVARKHADKLRKIAIVAGGLVPAVLTVLLPYVGVLAIPFAFATVLFGMAGVLVERWLFFAEAKHTVMLYYGDSNR